MSESTTLSPSFSPDFTWIAFTELFPNETCTRVASPDGVRHLEQTHRAVVLAERRTPHIEDVVQPFELDRAVHAQVGHRARAAVRRSMRRQSVTVPFAAAGSLRLTRPE